MQVGIERAAETLEEIQGARVDEMTVNVEGNEIVEYRVNVKVTFVLKG